MLKSAETRAGMRGIRTLLKALDDSHAGGRRSAPPPGQATGLTGVGRVGNKVEGTKQIICDRGACSEQIQSSTEYLEREKQQRTQQRCY